MLICRTNEVRVDVATKIDAVLRDKGISRHEFSKRIGVPVSVLTEFFKGNVDVSLGTLVKMGDVLDSRVRVDVEPMSVVAEMVRSSALQ